MCFLSGCPSGGSIQQTPQETALIGDLGKNAQFGLSQAQTVIPQAEADLGPVSNFYGSLVSGDRTKIANVLEPDLSTMSNETQQGRQAESQFAPRGGGRTAADEELRFQNQGTVENLISEAQQEGAAGETSIAQILADLGTNLLGESGSTASSGASLLEDQRQYNSTYAAKQSASLGSAIGYLLNLV